MRYLPVRICALSILSLLASGCTGVSYSYTYLDVSQPYPWGSVLVRLVTNTSSSKDGVSMMKGPYRFVVSVWVNDGAALPASCMVKFQSAALHRADGGVAANVAPRDVPARIANYGTATQYRPDPSGKALAGLSESSLDLPYQDYHAAVAFRLDGCGAIDGGHHLRTLMKTNYEKRRINAGWEAIMGI